MAQTSAMLYLSQRLIHTAVVALYKQREEFRTFSLGDVEIKITAAPEVSINPGAAEGRFLRLQLPEVYIQSSIVEFTLPVTAEARVEIRNNRLGLADIRAQVVGSNPKINEKVTALLNNRVVPTLQSKLQEHLNQIPLDLPLPTGSPSLGPVELAAAQNETVLSLACDGLPGTPTGDPNPHELQAWLAGESRVMARISWSAIDAMIQGFIATHLPEIVNFNQPFTVETPVSGVKIWLSLEQFSSFLNGGTPYLKFSLVPRLQIWFPIVGYQDFWVPSTEFALPVEIYHSGNQIHARLIPPQELFAIGAMIQALAPLSPIAGPIVQTLASGLMALINGDFNERIIDLFRRTDVTPFTLPEQPIKNVPAHAQIYALGIVGNDLQAIVEITAP